MPTLSDDFLNESRGSLQASADKIKHCVAQLTDEQIWWRPRDSQNSVGNLILHVCGNLRQRIGSVVGSEPDVRDRPVEFSEQGPIPKNELVSRLDETCEQSQGILSGLDAAALTEDRRYQGLGREFQATVLGVIYRTVTHLSGHAQEIVFMTRQQIGDDYQFQLPNP